MQNISQTLVEQVAAAVYAKQTKGVEDLVPDFEDLSAGTKQTLRENTLEFLNLVVPAMLTDGWLPTTKQDAIREAISPDQRKTDCKEALAAFHRNVDRHGYTTTGEQSAYTEGIEHALTILGERIHHILAGTNE